MRKLIECIPNFSEGRRQDVIDQVAAAVRGVAGVRLLDVSPNRDHNRTVVTFVGEPEAVAEAAFASTQEAVRLIDMNKHKGEHPRMGAMDVVPFVPVAGVTMDDAVALANSVGKRIAGELEVPVYLYAAAATTPTRKRLPDIRQGQYEGLQEAITRPERKPDFGQPKMHPTSGATAVGARPPLIAFNVNLGTTHLQIAKNIAKGLRESSGGLVNVQAMGVDLAAEGLVQVSMNLTRFERTELHHAFEAVRREAERLGVEVLASEVVGLVPQAALDRAASHFLRLENYSADLVLENRIAAALERKRGGGPL